MAINFTPDQQKVIDVRNKNVLVAAAAGSGKTAVLVERIIQLITDKEHPVDIDRLLVVTFTNAAAAQMRERIYQAIVKKQEENPDDSNLARQATLVHTAMITTIHSFCLFLLHNHFHEIGLDPAFRIADEGEMSLMRQEVMTELLEECYAAREEQFLKCKAYFAPRIKDQALADAIYKLYQFAMSYPWPVRWLSDCKKDFCVDTEEALNETEWMKLGLSYARQYLLEDLKLTEEMKKLCDESDGPYMYGENADKDAALVEALLSKEDYEGLRNALGEVKFSTLSRKKDESVSEEKKDAFKAMRDVVKADVKRLKEQFFFDSTEEILNGISESREAVETLIDLTISFMERFRKRKALKNVIDFSDMEHLALKVLLKGEGNEPTETALSYREFFEEIMIDEYQDSNLVQELLLSAISREESRLCNNRFMVGDIKQSIYRFRLARPEIFLEKYKKYDTTENNDKCVRIDLHQNFRSRREVVDSVNAIFKRIMTESVGGVVYDEKAALYPGAQYPDVSGEQQSFETELMIYESAPSEEGESAETNKGADEEKFELGNREKEAAMVASKIKELVGNFNVTDEETREPRRAQYRDIVILLRSNQGWDEVFKKVLTEQGIPVHTESKTGYFAADEIQTVMNFLRILSNPRHDIPLAAVLTSVFGKMDAGELAELRIIDKQKGLYENLLCSENKKAIAFREKLLKYREMSDYTGVYDLLCIIMQDFHYLEYVSALPGGEQRKANVEMLLQKAVSFEKTSYHGLYSFIHYMEKLQKYEVDFGEADTTEEEADTVRIMSIHKSKGLEFPICFMAGMAKKINLMDLRSNLLMDVELGLAVPVINCDKRVKKKSARKEILAQKMKLDSLGEELRILYVGLTRAKEKLFLCGCIPDYEAYMGKLKAISGNGDTVPFSRLAGSSSHLEYVLSAVGEGGLYTRLYHEEDLFAGEFKEAFSKTVLKEELMHRIKTEENETFGDGEIQDENMQRFREQLEDKFSFVYPYDYLAKLYTKTSVSELKKAHIHENEETNVVFETDMTQIPYLPEFMQEEKKSSGVNRGSAYHRVLELLDYNALYALYEKYCGKDYGEIPGEELLQFTEDEFFRIRTSGKMAEDIELVEQKKIGGFLKSRAAWRMARAEHLGKLYKEQPFVMAIPAERVVDEIPKDTEKVLIQGIIDVFFYETDDETGKEEVVVLDYKTDRVSSEKELVERYRVQLDYYAEALGKLTGLNVKEKIIYGFFFGKELFL